MTPFRSARVMVAAVALAVLLGVGAARAAGAEPVAQAPPGGDLLSLSMRAYGGPAAQAGDFSGKLVCLRCDLGRAPDAKAQCEKHGHRHALLMDDGSMVHPLLAGTEAVLDQINSNQLHGAEVTVHGIYYPSTGAIFTDRIAAKQSER